MVEWYRRYRVKNPPLEGGEGKGESERKNMEKKKTSRRARWDTQR